MHNSGQQMTMDAYLVALVIRVEILVLTVECVSKVLLPGFLTDFHQLRSILGAKSA